MALNIGSVTSGQALFGNRQTGRTVFTGNKSAGANKAPELQLPDGLVAGRFVTVRNKVDIREAQEALKRSVTAGRGIVSALKSLKESLKAAGHSSLVNPETAGVIYGETRIADDGTYLQEGGTRVSRLIIHSQAGRLIEKIDELVEQVEHAGANFIASGASDIRIQTTEYGGSIAIIPQPLDSAGLGLEDLYILSDEGADLALAKVEDAINTATLRLSRLESLERALGFDNATGQSLSSALNSVNGGSGTRGRLVDITV